MSTIIRLARPEDIPALIDLAAETFIDNFGDYHTPENCKAFIARSHNSAVYNAAIISESDFLLVAESEGKFLGYLYAKPMELPVGVELNGAHELSKIYVRKSEQSRGLGLKLLKRWETWADSNHYKDLVLGVWSENVSAQKFYTRQGYSKISDYKLKIGQVEDIDYIYHKAL